MSLAPPVDRALDRIVSVKVQQLVIGIIGYVVAQRLGVPGDAIAYLTGAALTAHTATDVTHALARPGVPTTSQSLDVASRIARRADDVVGNVLVAAVSATLAAASLVSAVVVLVQ